jgi:hypothetical protein
MTRLVWPFAALMLLSGCVAQPVLKFTAADASNAAAIDPAGATCYLALEATATAASGASDAWGILSTVAAERAFGGALQSPPCAPIEAGLLGKLLRLTPAAPFLP